MLRKGKSGLTQRRRGRREDQKPGTVSRKDAKTQSYANEFLDFGYVVLNKTFENGLDARPESRPAFGGIEAFRGVITQQMMCSWWPL